MAEDAYPSADVSLQLTREAGRVVVLDVVGLRPEHLRDDLAPNLTGLLGQGDGTGGDEANDGEGGLATHLQPAFPALTVPAQTTLATGQSPGIHGDVASGEYDRETDTVEFWDRDRGDRTRIWEAASDEAGLTTGALFFQHLIGTTADVAVTPSPIEDEDNNILEMNCWTNPDGFYDDLEAEYGHFPLHTYWGPGANEESTRWILDAARESVERFDPDLLWVYVPHLDYAGLRSGPDSDDLRESVQEADGMVGEFLDHLRDGPRWDRTAVAVVSEYGFHDVDTPVFPNRALREAGLLEVKSGEASVETDEEGGTEVDLAASDAFAMVDHQVAHVYAGDDQIPLAHQALADLDGVDEILDFQGKEARGIDHPNAGELVLVAEPDAWFQYYWWDEDEQPPDYADSVDIHEKPGFDPCELFFGETGMASLDPSKVGGSHGRADEPCFGVFGLGGPAAPTGRVDVPVDARVVAPTVAALLGISDEVGMSFEAPSILGS